MAGMEFKGYCLIVVFRPLHFCFSLRKNINDESTASPLGTAIQTFVTSAAAYHDVTANIA
jgi:hypothetical protein